MGEDIDATISTTVHVTVLVNEDDLTFVSSGVRYPVTIQLDEDTVPLREKVGEALI